MSGQVEFDNFSLANEVYSRVMSGLNKANKTSPAFAELYANLYARGIRVIEFYSSPPIGFRDTNVAVMSKREHDTFQLLYF